VKKNSWLFETQYNAYYNDEINNVSMVTAFLAFATEAIYISN